MGAVGELREEVRRRGGKGERAKRDRQHDESGAESEVGKSKKKAKKKKRKKSKRGQSDSDSKSSSQSSSSSQEAVPFVAWRAKGRNKAVNYEHFARVDIARFKKRAQLLAFAHKRPGVLTAHVLNLIKTKMGHGNVTQTKQLRKVELASWVASGQSGLKELRDQREAHTLAAIVDHINNDRVAQAMDVAMMRLTALTRAKSAGGSWEKASKMELIGDGAEALGPSGLSAFIG